MTVFQASPHLFPALYSGTPKVVVLGMSGAPSALAMPDTAIDWYGCDLIETEQYVLTRSDDPARALPSALQVLEVPPTNVWALWAPDASHEPGLRLLQNWWMTAGGSASDVPIVVGDKAQLDRAILARSLREIQKAQQNNQLLMRDLAALRESWSNHVRIPAEIEDVIAALRLGGPRLSFTSPFAKGDVAIPASSDLPQEQRYLLQPLPASARGLLGIDLYVADPGAGAGSLHAQIEAADAGTILARWRVRLDDLCKGWLPLRLKSASVASSPSLILRVWAADADVAPRLSTSPTGLLHEYKYEPQRSSGPDHKDDPHMLAVKLWGGLPGMTYARPEGGHAHHRIDGATVPIPDMTIAKVFLTREQTASYPVFGYMQSGKVLLRPLKTTPSAAVIKLPATPGLIEISCEAVIDDNRCQTRQLGARLIVTPSGIGPDDAEDGRHVLAATEWIELSEPLEASRLVARLAFAQNQPVDLHIFTRLPEPGPIPAHARIVFSRFEAEIHAASAWGMADVLPVSTVPA